MIQTGSFQIQTGLRLHVGRFWSDQMCSYWCCNLDLCYCAIRLNCVLVRNLQHLPRYIVQLSRLNQGLSTPWLNLAKQTVPSNDLVRCTGALQMLCCCRSKPLTDRLLNTVTIPSFSTSIRCQRSQSTTQHSPATCWCVVIHYQSLGRECVLVFNSPSQIWYTEGGWQLSTVSTSDNLRQMISKTLWKGLGRGISRKNKTGGGGPPEK